MKVGRQKELRGKMDAYEGLVFFGRKINEDWAGLRRQRAMSSRGLATGVHHLSYAPPRRAVRLGTLGRDNI